MHYHVTPKDGIAVNGALDFAPVFSHLLAAHPNGQAFDIAPGEYHFFPEEAPSKALAISNTDSTLYPIKPIGILFENKRGIHLRGNGATFVFHANLMAVCLLHCIDIKLSGLTISYACPCVIDGQVESFDGQTALVKIPETYSFEAHENCVYFQSEKSPYTGKPYWQGENGLSLSQRRNATGHTRRVDRDLFDDCIGAKKTGPHGLLLHYGRPRQDICPGDIFQMRDTKRETSGIFINECESVSFCDTRICFTPSMGIISQNSRDLTFSKVCYQANTPYYSASGADMLHFSNCRGHILIENCVFDNPHDDPINVHGTYLEIEHIEGTLLALRYRHPQSTGFPVFYPGDLAQIIIADTLESIGVPIKVITVQNPKASQPDRGFITVSGLPPLPQGLRLAIENLSASPDVTIQNCLFSHVPTRGILAGGSGRIRIIRNHFQQIHMACIYHAADATDWFESGPVQDAETAYNTFSHCHDAFIKLEPTTGVHQNIRAHHNYILP